MAVDRGGGFPMALVGGVLDKLNKDCVICAFGFGAREGGIILLVVVVAAVVEEGEEVDVNESPRPNSAGGAAAVTTSGSCDRLVGSNNL